MGIAQTLRAVVEGMKAGPIGYPAPGWAPPPGYVGTSTSGVTINEERANTVAAWFAGVRVISEDVASLPLILYRRSGPNGSTRDRAMDHPLYGLLHDSPNPEMTSFSFRETLQAHALAWGNGYAEMELNASGRVIAMWPLRPDRMAVTWEHGRKVYTYTQRMGADPIRFPAGRIFHLMGIGGDGLTGWSVLRMARETLGSAIALRDYGNRVVKNDARPGVVMTHPGTLNDKARENLKRGWNEANEREGAGRTALLEEGITLTTLGFPPEDVQFLESQQWQVTEIARWLRVAPHKIGDLSRATFSNIEEQGLDHVVSTLRAWLVRWEQQLNKDVVREPSLYVEHLVDALLRGDSVTRASAANIQFRAGVLLGDEWRAMENRNPLPDGLGASPMVSADMQSMGELRDERAATQMMEQVKTGLLTLDEARTAMGRAPMEWAEGPSPDEMASLLEQFKSGILTHDEVRAMLKRPPMEWSDDISPDEVASLIEQVKGGILTENEAREMMKRPPMEWAEGPSPDDIATLVAQIKEGLLTVDEARASLGRAPVQWPEDLSEKVTQANDLIKAGFDPADVLRTLGLPPIQHLGLPPVTVQKVVDPAGMAPDAPHAEVTQP